MELHISDLCKKLSRVNIVSTAGTRELVNGISRLFSIRCHTGLKFGVVLLIPIGHFLNKKGLFV
jgi:hypothetical protein